MPEIKTVRDVQIWEDGYKSCFENTTVVCEARSCIHHEACKDRRLVHRKGHQVCLWLSIKVTAEAGVKWVCCNYERKEKVNE